MKSIKIEAPEGYEIDKEKSTFDLVFFKRVEGFKYPLDVKQIPFVRSYFIDSDSTIQSAPFHKDKNQVSTESRAKAFLALMQLVELRDAWNEVDNFKVDWTNPYQIKFTITIRGGSLMKDSTAKSQSPLYFKHYKTRDLFLSTFSSLILEAKELL